MLLPTCIRCRSRRKKCDSLLPACSSCAKSDSECLFRDEALQENIPRRYLQSLHDRAQELSSQLALHQCRPRSELAQESPEQDADASPSSATDDALPIHIDAAAGLGVDLNFNQLFPSRLTFIAFEALTTSSRAASAVSESVLAIDVSPDPVPVAPTLAFQDRSMLTPNVVRYLLGRYGSCLGPRYNNNNNLLAPELLANDGVSFRKLPDGDAAKVKIILACATAAAYEAYRLPAWRSLAQICRDWAGELATPILSAGDRDAVALTVMLLIFELAEPSRGLAWDLMNLATRMCLQLGWLHRPRLSETLDTDIIPDDLAQTPTDRDTLMATLRDIDRTLQSIFHRPSMLNTSKPAMASDSEGSEAAAFSLRSQIYDEVYGQGSVLENKGCPFVGRLGDLLNTIMDDELGAAQETSPSAAQAMMQETLLLLLPVCVKHKQCISCFQEPDDEQGTDTNSKGMRSLRLRVIESSSRIISSVHSTSVVAGGFSPPLVSCVSVFSAGCCLVTAAVKGWTSMAVQAKAILNCTEVLTLFSTQWKGGRRYLEVWRALTGLIDFSRA